MKSRDFYILILSSFLIVLLSACSNTKNTAQTRWWHAFTARYNTYYNGSVAYIDGALEKEKGNVDDFTEDIPLYIIGNKESRSIGAGNFDKAIEKCEKAIKLHSITKRPEWKKNRRKTEADKEWLSRREYNPFLWKAWFMMGRSQFMKGEFEEAASTFIYMSRLYETQPSIRGVAQAWLARCYTENDWFYEAEDVIRMINRDTITWRTQRELDGTMADYYLCQNRYAEAVPYLKKVIKQEKRKDQRAREWFLMGQVETHLGHKEEAYRAYGKCIHNNPPYILSFNARIARTEVMADKNVKGTISRLRRMSRNVNNKDYLDQVYYALGNVYLSQKDTVNAIAEYEKGVEKATRAGIEKGVLLLKLGNIYWEQEKYSDAQRCYGQAIGLLDQERDDYDELSKRSKVLDELVPYTDAVHLQDSLQVLANMDSVSRDKAIDRVIAQLIQKEKEEKRKAEEEAAEAEVAKQQATGNTAANRTNTPSTPTTAQSNGQWYFYNQQAVQQGKNSFVRLWGKRDNADDWQRMNKTVVAGSSALEEPTEGEEMAEVGDSVQNIETDVADAVSDSLANDPHRREYYYAQIPMTEDALIQSNLIIMDGLYNSGVIFKDKLNNLSLAEKALLRLENDYSDYENMADAYYHLYLLYARKGDMLTANTYVAKLQEHFPDDDWTKLLSDPNFVTNQMFGIHIEDSLYAATYEAFKAGDMRAVRTNTEVSDTRFPIGANRSKFLFIDGLRKLNENDAKGCLDNMQQVIDKYPQSEVAEMAGNILNGVKEGRQLRGGAFDAGSIWERRSVNVAESDSTAVAQALSTERNTNFIFLLAFPEGKVNENQLLYDLARHNFTNYLVRNFDIVIEHESGIGRMEVRGFRSYDEAWQYSHQLLSDEAMRARLPKEAKVILISEDNFVLLGSSFSYKDYEDFYRKNFAPVKVSEDDLLQEPEEIEYRQENEDEQNEDSSIDVIDDWEMW
ncbi:MAG: tetratricopeptide repeat protein [Prevotella sp.]|nr:tetratricopeptide repeat protein [Prevotella sp.]